MEEASKSSFLFHSSYNMDRQRAIELFEMCKANYDSKLELKIPDKWICEEKTVACIDNKRVISLNWEICKDLSDEELLQTLCHEIGHDIIRRLKGGDVEDKESICHQLAGFFLAKMLINGVRIG